MTLQHIQELEDREVEQLLERGDAPTRVWALWTTALRRQADAVDPARRRLAREPDPGVRRHLLLVLAGLGERRLLRRFVELDPSPYVRGTAARLLWQTATAPERHAVASFLSDRLPADPSHVVRLAILQTQDEAASLLSSAALLTCAADPDRETRSVAYRMLFARDDEDVGAALLPRVLAEEADDLRKELTRWHVSRGRRAELVRIAARTTTESVTHVLEDIGADATSLPWEVLSPLSQHEDRHLAQSLAYYLRRDEAHHAVEFLLGLCRDVRVHEDGQTQEQQQERVARWRYHETVQDVILDGIVQKAWDPAPVALRAPLDRFRESIARVAAYWEEHSVDWSDEWAYAPDGAKESWDATQAEREAALDRALGRP